MSATPTPRPDRDAVAAAFAEFLRRGAHGRDWPAWSSLFTDDAVYTEHCLGQFHGAEGIRAWILAAMEPVACMTFSVEWSIIDGPYVAFWIWNHVPDPTGGGRQYAFPNLSILTLADDGRWSAEEDLYDPAWSETAIIDWYRAGGTPQMDPDPSLVPHASSHPAPPTTAAERDVVARALAAATPPGAAARITVIDGSVGVAVCDTDERTVGVIVHVDGAGTTTFSDTVTNPREQRSAR
jgi:hypothetical protein